MANTIKQKRGTSDPGASDLVVGELAINTTDGGVFTKTDGGSVVEVGAGGGGASAIGDLSDATTNSSGQTIGVGTSALDNDNGTTNRNTAFGYEALKSATTAEDNTAAGNSAARSLTTGTAGTYLGFSAGYSATTATNNAYIGFEAGYYSTGSANVAIGWKAMYGSSGNTTGSNNLCIGKTAGYNLTSGATNTFFGNNAGDSVTTGANNLVLGFGADTSSATVSNEITLGNSSISSLRIPGLQSGASNGQVLTYNSTNGNIVLADAGGGGASAINDLSDAKTDNSDAALGLGTGTLAADDGTNSTVAVGKDALNDQTSGNFNCAVGVEALSKVTTAGQSAAFGVYAGRRGTGSSNTFVGYSAGEGVSGSTTANFCVGVGEKCMENHTSGGDHTAVGYRALRNVTSGLDNVAIGYQSADAVTTGSNNVFLGHEAGTNFTTGSNVMALGHNAQPSSNTVSDEITLGDASVSSLRCNVQTISSLSDARDKTDVQELPEGLDFISKLNPVKFQWQTRDGNGKDGTYEAGFIAQDLQYVQQQSSADYLRLVIDSNPDRLEASYGKLVPMLVKAIQELKSEVEQLKGNV